MTTSDAPQPPGGPQRQDAADGDFAPDEEREPLSEAEPEHGSDDAKDVPAVSLESEQPDADAEAQEENAETALDQPSQ